MDTSKYSRLDRPEILQFIFYPRQYVSERPEGSIDYSVPVGDGVSVGCRFYVHSKKSPSIIFFHGNGEIVSDYDYMAPLYNDIGINLFVADYRGYGSSNGMPGFASMAKDAHSIYHAFIDMLACENYTGSAFVMGRSLGSISAIELAASYPSRLKGLIVESGFASVVRLLEHLGFPATLFDVDDVSFPNAALMKTISLPTLIIHGDYDNIVPFAEPMDLFNNAASENKNLLVINGAGHNDIMMVGEQEYFAAIKKFVEGK